MINDAEGSRNTINSWVAKQTDDKITDGVGEGTITRNTRLIITNAVYFKGTWVKQFEKAKTTETLFTLSSGEGIPVMMMARNDTNAQFNYGEKDNVQILEMPYESGMGKPLSMLVLLPLERNLTRLERTLDAGYLADLKKSMTNQLVLVYVPKFHEESGYQLSSNLAAMGMPTAFSPSADFSGIDGTQNLGIDKIVHRAYVDVNEEGTEAAAATFVYHTIKGPDAAPHPPEFHADHPFIFIIQDRENGNILFMGRVMNPNEA
jgi:serpin B